MQIGKNMQIKLNLFTVALVASSGFATTSSFAASFIMLNDPSLSTGFEQRWNQPAIWQYVSGVDDGVAGIPDGNDTFTINRNTGGFAAGATDLSNEGMPNNHTIAGITATGASGRDIILKTANTVIGNLTVQASANVFEIQEERNRSLTINGLISGAGDLLLSRAGGFTGGAGVQPTDLITITGALPNTITGAVTLQNLRNSLTDPQPSYWLADKVGAFGQTSTLTLQGTATGLAQLQFSANTMGGEGAIDDDATTFIIGENGLLSVDAEVNEVIGSGKLFVLGNQIADGTYTDAESWIIGPGTITVGALAVIPEPSSFALLGLGSLLAAARRRRC